MASLDELIVQTQQTIGSLIAKPKMAEKYLKKPPFRFLHDIVCEVIRATGFAATLFTPDEMDAATMTDKAAKVGFLSKIISATFFALGQDGTDVLPKKIVAGLEPENTNIWLLSLFQASTQALGNSEQACARVLQGDSAITRARVPVWEAQVTLARNHLRDVAELSESVQRDLDEAQEKLENPGLAMDLFGLDLRVKNTFIEVSSSRIEKRPRSAPPSCLRLSWI